MSTLSAARDFSCYIKQYCFQRTVCLQGQEVARRERNALRHLMWDAVDSHRGGERLFVLSTFAMSPCLPGDIIPTLGQADGTALKPRAISVTASWADVIKRVNR